MKTQKFRELKINFPSNNLSLVENKYKTPKLSINNSSSNLLKENYKINELKLPSIKCLFSSSNSTNQNSNYEIKQISLKKNGVGDSFFEKINRQNLKLKNLFGNRFKNISIYKEKNDINKSLKQSNSTTSILIKNFKKYKIKKDLNFHRDLMAINNEKLNNYINEQNNKITEDSYLKSIAEDPSKKQPKTGIFGPRNNIINIIRAEMERLKYDNIYKGVEEDIKELIKDEIMDAQVKLKRKPENLVFNKKLQKPFYIQKMEKYKYISSMNKIRELNQVANISVIEHDGNIMKRLANDAYDALMNHRGENI
jgi:hypothetical protein